MITIAHVIGLLSAIAIFWGGALVGVYLNDNKASRLKYEAVKNGFAKWKVDNNGCTEFEWNKEDDCVFINE